MHPNLWWIVIAAVLVGHFGLNVAIYNRLNATGMPRRTLKRITKLFLAWTIVFPFLAGFGCSGLMIDLLQNRPLHLPIPLWLACYGSLCLTAWVVLGIPWLIWRPLLGIEWVKVSQRVETVDVEAVVAVPLARTTKCKLARRLPWNQILELSINEVELPVERLPAGLDGYRIAQLSDVHLTGDVGPEFAAYAVDRATQWQPDLIALTGDIIDKQPCIDWLFDIFSPAQAKDGCYFILGNHDTRIVNCRQTREAMARSGWIDLGGRFLDTELAGVPTTLIGNEFPWFQLPKVPKCDEPRFRFLLSHSPDQLSWARKHDVVLMLAGHTHGGQGRLPLFGPVLGPSYHGSRYASGDFFRSPTTMHVSRGLSGTHLLRINCRPELSLITLRVQRHDDVRTCNRE